jgi:flavorubredoxin
MWESTHQLARTLEERFRQLGHPVRLLSLHTSHRSDVITELLDAGAICVGSPTLNNQMFPTLADFLTYAAGLKRQHLLGLAFGSYGWSGESVKKVADALTAMNVEVVGACRCKYRPDAEALERCREAATQLSTTLRARLEQAQ